MVVLVPVVGVVALSGCDESGAAVNRCGFKYGLFGFAMGMGSVILMRGGGSETRWSGRRGREEEDER